MKTFIILVTSLTCLCIFTTLSYAFRCGEGNKYLATENMHKFQILKDCGPPVSQEVVGYDKEHGSHRIIEEWLYIVKSSGQNQIYLIKFDRDGVAVKIDWLGSQN